MAALPGVEDALLYALPVRVFRTRRELEQGALHGQHVGSVVWFARRSELQLPGLVGQSVAKAELRLGGAVQQAIRATVVRSGVDLTLLVLPQGLEVGGRHRESCSPGHLAQLLAGALQREAVGFSLLSQLVRAPPRATLAHCAYRLPIPGHDPEPKSASHEPVCKRMLKSQTYRP